MTRLNIAFWSIVLIGLSSAQAQNLREAVRENDVQRVKVLLESGEDVNKKYENRLTPIYFANSPEVVDLLLAYGAKLDMRDAASIQSPIENAAENFFYEKEHQRKWKVIVGKLRDAGAEYTIDTAILMNDTEFIRKRLTSDASWINSPQDSQTVPLRDAAQKGRLEICRLLLKHGADPDSFEEGNGEPIIVAAIRSNHPLVVKLLISSGANLRRRIFWYGGKSGTWFIHDGATALHFAAQSGNLESTRQLVEAGLDTSASDMEGQTPLHIALHEENFLRQQGEDSSGFPNVIAYLLEHDASLEFRDRQGKTPLDVAEELDSPQPIFQLLFGKKEEMDARYQNVLDASLD